MNKKYLLLLHFRDRQTSLATQDSAGRYLQSSRWKGRDVHCLCLRPREAAREEERMEKVEDREEEEEGEQQSGLIE